MRPRASRAEPGGSPAGREAGPPRLGAVFLPPRQQALSAPALDQRPGLEGDHWRRAGASPDISPWPQRFSLGSFAARPVLQGARYPKPSCLTRFAVQTLSGACHAFGRTPLRLWGASELFISHLSIAPSEGLNKTFPSSCALRPVLSDVSGWGPRGRDNGRGPVPTLEGHPVEKRPREIPRVTESESRVSTPNAPAGRVGIRWEAAPRLPRPRTLECRVPAHP